jgi:hypothetical protein
VSKLPVRDAKPSRRQFTHGLALLAATPLLAPDQLARAADEPPSPDPIAAAAAALTEAARLRFGDKLADEHIKKVTASIQRGLSLAQVLKRANLTNADEPAFVFRADLP